MSTGFECHIIERERGQWYYLLQNWDCPVGAWDWREYATAYGPFATADEARTHLGEHHANPGGSTTYSLTDVTATDEVLEQRFSEAVSPWSDSQVRRYR